MKWPCLIAVLTVALLPLVAQATDDVAPSSHSAASSTADRINVLPHGFPLKTVPFNDAQGNSHDFNQYKGKVVIVNMWATWCPPCVRELPSLDRFSQKLADDNVVLVPISIDQTEQQQVRSFLNEQGMQHFNSFYDPHMQLSEIFPLDTIPATFILSPEGTLVAFVRSFVDWDDPKVEQKIRKLITQHQKSSNSAVGAAK
ncbi:TlpA family protein disulfide reductase [Shewanella sp. C32]|uniref:TlpA family protein disulfide reductase n=1 Tax=Shewanella electrica TaxID=515560 RepID=A0ABT2FMY0_9GAMM|nr:TlpA disulfide reductase family protein [Shewanella electrica]MCH1926336.1 TlpA family protein disulfide reductase [Shewanella electrica]MCS4557697.1 TlpA family protein disulfide reductase [Shewanella electrica]